MHRRIIFLVLALVLMVYGCSEERETTPITPVAGEELSPDVDAEAQAWAIVGQAGWPTGEEQAGAEAFALRHNPHWPIAGFERETVVGDIVHYSVRVRFGPGEFDEFGLHRVVRETRPNCPIRTRHSVFLQHGDIKDFVGMFLPGVSSPRMPDDFGLAVTLAQADIDVWGIDQAWTLVPAEVTDLTFMADWDMERNVADLDTAIRIARTIRRLTGNGYRQMALLGYSSGAVTSLALLNAETQIPPGRRQVCGFIAGDYGMLSDDPDWIAGFEEEYPQLLEMIQLGIYYLESPFPIFGFPALYAPDDSSELIPGLTNLQAGIGLGAWVGYPGTYYHFVAGIFDEFGIPVGLQYTQVDMWVDFMVTGPPYEALPFYIDCSRCGIPSIEVPWDDHLSEIALPVFRVNAVGGAGEYAGYTFEVMTSADITRIDIGFHPPEEILLEFAHVDLFIADDAPTLVFEPIRDWVLAHTP